MELNYLAVFRKVMFIEALARSLIMEGRLTYKLKAAYAMKQAF